MLDQLIDLLQAEQASGTLSREPFTEREIAPKTVLLQAGEISSEIHFIRKGCLRQWFNKDGKDITIQFFFENQAVASIESFVNQQPSSFTIESIEPSVIVSISKDAFEKLNARHPELKDRYYDYLFGRFINYAQLFLSRIKDSPAERYQELVRNHPEIIRRVPQHYIASYLGITPISLSRIRNRK